jgi:hypothetical protein
MKSIIFFFKKYNLFELCKNSIKGKYFIRLVLSIPLLGTSRKGLELIRLISQFKLNSYLKVKYDKIINKEECINDETKNSNFIWFCWLQGIENAPKLVQTCFRSIEKISGWQVVLITKDNYIDYTDLPKYITEKWSQGKISNTHFSDILRLDLLVRNGGLWIDSTVYFTGDFIPKFISDSDLFLFQNLKPGFNGHTFRVSSWLIFSKTNNKILSKTRELIFEYWKCNNSLIDYFLVHHFLSISLEKYNELANRIPKFPNSIPHILLLQIFEPFNLNNFNYIKSICSFHKLNYKRNKEQFDLKDTYYKYIIEK